jgi:hypothetical protein
MVYTEITVGSAKGDVTEIHVFRLAYLRDYLAVESLRGDFQLVGKSTD